MTYSYFQYGNNYTDYTSMYRIKNAETMQVANWLKFGMKTYLDKTTDIQYFGLDRPDPMLVGVRVGIYSNLPLK
jgi:hypothetical protein